MQKFMYYIENQNYNFLSKKSAFYIIPAEAGGETGNARH